MFGSQCAFIVSVFRSFLYSKPNYEKIIQDITLCQPCFLAQLEWRDLIRRHASLRATDNGLCEHVLRWDLCIQLMEAPNYLVEASYLLKLPSTDVGHSSVEYLNMARCMLKVRERFQSWYVEELIPRFTPGHHRTYADIFSAIMDFVSNLALAQMERTYCRLLSHQPTALSAEHYLSNLPTRQPAMLEAISFVRQYSKAAVEPIEYDLQLLFSWINSG